MRVTFNAIYSGIESVNDAAERFVRAHRQVESGKRVQVGSDDPAAALRITTGNAELGTLDSYTRASDGAASRLSVMDTMLTDIVDKITGAQVAVTSVRGTTAAQNARDAAAARLRGLRDSLADDINTSFNGRYLFSGAEVQSESYALVGGVWTYQGDNTAVTIDIGTNRNVRTTLDGQAIFQGSDPTDLLTALEDLAVAAETNDQTALTAGLDTLQRAFDRATRAQSQIGADQRGVDEELERLRSFKLVSKTAVSKDQDADLVAAITELTKADEAYRAALGAIGTTQRISLLDYLR